MNRKGFVEIFEGFAAMSGDGTHRVHPQHRRSIGYFSSSCGTLPPFSASFRITSVCNQMFIEALSF